MEFRAFFPGRTTIIHLFKSRPNNRFARPFRFERFTLFCWLLTGNGEWKCKNDKQGYLDGIMPNKLTLTSGNIPECLFCLLCSARFDSMIGFLFLRKIFRPKDYLGDLVGKKNRSVGHYVEFFMLHRG